MNELNVKIPTSKEEMDALRASLRTELSLDELDSIVGGNDDLKDKNSTMWTCHFCGQTIACKKEQDAAKHMTKCPNNPFL